MSESGFAGLMGLLDYVILVIGNHGNPDADNNLEF